MEYGLLQRTILLTALGWLVATVRRISASTTAEPTASAWLRWVVVAAQRRAPNADSGEAVVTGLPGNGENPIDLSQGHPRDPDRSSRSLKSKWWLVAGVSAVGLGTIMALVVVRVGVGQTAGSQAYVDQPAYAVWGGLVLLQLPIWMLLGVVSAWWAKETRLLPPEDDRPRWQIFLAWLGAVGGLLALLGAQALAMPLDYKRSYPDWLSVRVGAMAAVVLFVAAIPAVALWGLRRAAEAIKSSNPPAAIDRFNAVWSRQQQFLGVLSAIFVLVMLSTAAKFAANNSFEPPHGKPLPEVPTTYVLVAGALYGALLLVAYLPPHLAIRRAGYALAEELAMGADNGVTPAPDTLRERRVHYRDALGLNESTMDQVKRGTVILAPLLSALVAALIPDVNV